MLTNNLGFPRIGINRELKKASEAFWAEKISADELEKTGMEIRLTNWKFQKDAGIDLIPSNDFSFYDQVLDMIMTVGAVPTEYICLKNFLRNELLEFYFSLARGYQKEGYDLPAMEMTKWFDTNYHYIVPELVPGQRFNYFLKKPVNEFNEAKEAGIITKPVLIGPLSFLLLSKVRLKGFDRMEMLPSLLPVYIDLLSDLQKSGAVWVQFDEPFLTMDLSDVSKNLYKVAYKELKAEFPDIKFMIATYFGRLGNNTSLALQLPVDALHIDLTRYPEQLEEILRVTPEEMTLSLGVVDGRNIWKNDYKKSLGLIQSAIKQIGEERIILSPSCSLIHSPIDLAAEKRDKGIPEEVIPWMSFAKQKINELYELRNLSLNKDYTSQSIFIKNQEDINSRRKSHHLNNDNVRNRIENIGSVLQTKRSNFQVRKLKQQKELNLPICPATTIGSFPQTTEVRGWRQKLNKGEITTGEYRDLIRNEIKNAIAWQEEAGLDVLVHGEFERNDMVEYFGEMMDGFAFTTNGWIQSYGSRYVKPPVIYGDVSRSRPMTTEWINYARSLTSKPVKGMLTGPVTILLWSFVRDDKPLSETCFQIALAIRDEVLDLEREGTRIIQIDEPALREGLPLRKDEWDDYLEWAVKAFRVTSSGVDDRTQIHTHMCYSEFNDIIQHIAALDADVITIECSRSRMEFLDVFANFNYPNDIGPGIYDIHSPRIPSVNEISDLLLKAAGVISIDKLWVNPDCGLKTRRWEEVKPAITNMIKAAKMMQKKSIVESREQ
ncbi:MAG TPA: 5-methyltetrahydropteroyltriglutamate--homocysteine S-methyltransferase [Bacteroidales bacterium]|nr:5-methyltetrahydropteroyltriglutamate--homocysteine S-methyltransferase [Bacteroidales bacterium]